LIFQNLFGGMFGNYRERDGAKSRARSMPFATVLEDHIFIPAWGFGVYGKTILNAVPGSPSGLFFGRRKAA
jgi:hypothetical protein